MPEISQREIELRTHFELRYKSMENERLSFLSHWQDIADHIRPRSVRINTTIDSSKGNKANARIIDSVATMASRTLRSGFMAGFTSPARPWFKLTTTDPDRAEYDQAKTWLYDVETKMRDIFTKSNLYQVLPMVYGDLGDCGTGAMFELEDDHAIVRFYHFLLGQYMISVDAKNRCDSLYRKYPRTVRQLVAEFRDKVTPTTMALYDSKQYETEIEVVHAIEPNSDRDGTKISNDNKPWRSVKYEANAPYGMFLSKSGFDEFPIFAPRWDLYDDSPYGTACPGMDSLGDIKALQIGEKRLAEAIDKWVRPPMIADSALRKTRTSTLPNDITYIDGLANQRHAGMRPLLEVAPETGHMGAYLERLEERIKKAFFEDMMMMMAESDNPQMTAREVEERHQEKVLILGPVMERLNDELFDPLIERTFGIMMRRGFPQPPQVLWGQPLKVEYTSILAQAQKLLGTANIEKVAGFVLEMGKVAPAAVDKFDVDEAIDTYSDMHGINPNIIRTSDQVKPLRALREKKDKAAQMAQMAKPMKEGAQAGKLAGETDGENLQQLVRGMSGQ